MLPILYADADVTDETIKKTLKYINKTHFNKELPILSSIINNTLAEEVVEGIFNAIVNFCIFMSFV